HVTSVDFPVDAPIRSSDNSSQYSSNGDGGSLDTTTLANGVHTLCVVVSAQEGTVTTSFDVTVQNGATPPPPLSFTVSSSIDGSSLSGTIRWRSSLSGITPAQVASVTYSIDDNPRWTVHGWSDGQSL